LAFDQLSVRFHFQFPIFPRAPESDTHAEQLIAFYHAPAEHSRVILIKLDMLLQYQLYISCHAKAKIGGARSNPDGKGQTAKSLSVIAQPRA